MTKVPKLFMVLLGCTPKGRNTEQHDVFFGIAEELMQLIPQIKLFWPEAKGKIHIDAWREVTIVDGFSIEVVEIDQITSDVNNLYFLNLGGYKQGNFEEYHYKMLAVAPKLAAAVKLSKKTVFYKHCGYKEAPSHIDDKFGIDVDDSHKVDDLLDTDTKLKIQLKITPLTLPSEEDKLHIGYLKLKKL